MKHPPVIFLAFANQVDAYLSLLKAERQGIQDKLLPLEQDNLIKVHTEPEATLQDIFQAFDTYRGRIKILHYAGHANSTHLALDAQDANGQGLADLIRQENQTSEAGLELVFLNGCATGEQVEALLEAGVKAVIATSVPIQDNSAQQFALQFYQSLALGSDIREAYQRAVAMLKAQDHPHAEEMLSTRDLGSRRKSNNPEESLPWGLYLGKQNQNPAWSIPQPGQAQPNVKYDKKNIFKFLNACYNDEALTLFCEFNFESVANNFAQGMSKNQKIMMLLDYAERHLEMENLLNLVQEEHTGQYQQYAPYVK